MADIFISYARNDARIAQSLSRSLQEQGFSVFWDRDIPTGHTFDSYILDQLRASRCVIALWSEAACTSQWVLEEASEARNAGKLVPALVSKIELPFGFRRLQTVDLIGWSGNPAHPGFARLLQDLRSISNAEIRRETKATTGKIFPRPFKIKLTLRAAVALLVFFIISAATVKAYETPIPHVTDAEYSPDGQRIVVSSFNGAVTIWDRDNHKIDRTFELFNNHSWYTYATFDPLGKGILVAADDDIRFYDNLLIGKHWSLTLKNKGSFNEVKFSPDGSKIAAVVNSPEQPLAIIFDRNGNELFALNGHGKGVLTVSFNQRGDKIVTADHDGTARVWDITNGSLLSVIDNKITCAAFGSDDQTVAVGTWDRGGAAYLYNWQTKKIIQTFVGHQNSVKGIAFSPDGRSLITASHDMSARIWDVSSGREIRKLEGHDDIVVTSVFNPKSSFGDYDILTSSFDGTAKEWSDTGHLLTTIKPYGFWYRLGLTRAVKMY